MKLKVDTASKSIMCTKTAEPRTDFETGQPKIDKATGLVLWQVQLMVLDSDGADVISVTVPGEPKVVVGQQVSVTNLVALPWNQNGKSGIAFRADAITPVDGKPTAPRS
jgi:hypothetical protein